MRNWLLDEKMDDMIMERNMAVADQDIALLNDVIPVMTPPTLTKEIFVPADLIIGEYRNSLDEYVKKASKLTCKKSKILNIKLPMQSRRLLGEKKKLGIGSSSLD